jgi:hypothetical protein
MKKKNGNHKILDGEKACSTAADIRDFEAEIEAEELHGNDKCDWRVARVGDVGSDSWNANMQEIELELENLQTRSIKSAVTKHIKRMKQLAGIAMPKVEALALKQAKKLK